MQPAEQKDSPIRKMARALRAALQREPEEVVRDCVIFISFTHMVALIFFIIYVLRVILCGTG